MFCPKCGGQVEAGGRFCSVCGTPMSQALQQAPMQQQATVQQMQQMSMQQQIPMQPVVIAKKKKLWLIPVIIGSALVIIAIVAVVVILAIANGMSNKYDGKVAMADKYLSDLNYAEAIAAYKEAIEISPGDMEAYLGLAQVYADMAEDCVDEGEYGDALDNYIEAVSVLEDGIKRCEDDSKLEKRKKKYYARYQEIEELKLRGAASGGADNSNNGNTASGTVVTPEVNPDEVDYISEMCKKLSGCWVANGSLFISVSEDGTGARGTFFTDDFLQYTIIDVEYDGYQYTATQYYHIVQSELYDEDEGTFICVYSSRDGFNNFISINNVEYVRMGDSMADIINANGDSNRLSISYYAKLYSCYGYPYTIVAYPSDYSLVDRITNGNLEIAVEEAKIDSGRAYYYINELNNPYLDIVAFTEEGQYSIAIMEANNAGVQFEIYYYGELIADTTGDWWDSYYRSYTGVWYFSLVLDHGRVLRGDPIYVN